MFEKTLVPNPLTISKEDPTKILDGNELGIYMSTNRSMSEWAYTSPEEYTQSFLQTPTYEERMSLHNRIRLPGCGVVLEINTTNLDIRKPQIVSHLRGGL